MLVIEAFLPFALTMFESIFELTDVYTAIFPLVLALTFRLAIGVGARIAIAICENVRSLAMLEAVLPLTFVSIAVLPLVHTVASGFRLLPFADV